MGEVMFFTVREAMRILRVSRLTIYKMIEIGTLKGFKVGGGRDYRILRESIESLTGHPIPESVMKDVKGEE